MSIYRPLTKVAVVLSLLFLVVLAIEPFTGFGQVQPDPLNIIGNRIYCDNNLDGLLSSGEFIPGVTVSVAHASSPFTDTLVTDAGGNYLFTGLPVDPSVSNTVTDTYTVTVDATTLPLECNVPVADPDGVLDNMSIVVFDANRTDNRNQKFGYQPPAGVVSAGTSSIGNYIFCDADLSGDSTNLVNQQPEGLPGVDVMLAYANGGTLNTTTDGNGAYTFQNVASGQYTVTVDTTDLPNACTTPFIDGDSDNTVTPTVNLDDQSSLFVQVGDNNSSQDFGYQSSEQLASIGDRVWCDDNPNTVYDGSSEGMGGVSLTITESGTTTPAVYTTVTDSIGRYFFYNLASGTYTVTVDALTLPATCAAPLNDLDGGNDSSAVVTVISGQKADTADFGYSGFLPIADLGGQMWCETTINGSYDIGEAPFFSIPVTLTDSSGITTTMLTDNFGTYLFANLVPDTYTIAVDSSAIPATCNAPSVDPDGTFDDQTTVVLAPAVDQLALNFAYEAPAPTPTPIPTDTPTPLPTDTPTMVPTDTPTTVPTETPTTVPTDTPTTVPTDTPTMAPTNTPIPGVTVTTAPATATTVPATATTMPTATATSTPIPPTPVVGQLGSIGGAVWCDNDGNNMMDATEALENVVITLVDNNDASGGSAGSVTNSDGAYLFDELDPSTYTIVVSGAPAECSQISAEPDNSIDASTIVNLVAGENKLLLNFLYRSLNATISDVIWNDTNGNGVQDNGEAGIAGVSVQLFDTSDALLRVVNSDDDGLYTITNIEPTQQYYMIFTMPSGWEIVSEGASDLNTTFTAATGRTGIFSVEPGTDGIQFAVVAAPEGGNSSIYLPFTARQ